MKPLFATVLKVAKNSENDLLFGEDKGLLA